MGFALQISTCNPYDKRHKWSLLWSHVERHPVTVIGQATDAAWSTALGASAPSAVVSAARSRATQLLRGRPERYGTAMYHLHFANISSSIAQGK